METSRFDRRGAAGDNEVFWGRRRDQNIMKGSARRGTGESLGRRRESNGRGEEQPHSNSPTPLHHSQMPSADSDMSPRRETLDQWSPQAPLPNERDMVALEHPAYNSHPERARMNLRLERTTGIFGRLGFLLIVIAWLSIPASAALIDFDNCLSDSMVNDVPYQLQIVPKFFDAVFNTTDPSHNLKVAAYFNVVGAWNRAIPPNENDTAYWSGNMTDRGGKIENLLPNADNKYTAASAKVDVLTYRTWSQNIEFCSILKDGVCPVGPRFNVNA